MMAKILLFSIRAYRASLSFMFAGQCRYVPSCSAYAEEAINRYGAWCGAWLALKRLARCHPFHAGGIDPVP
jgi:putative membrane protein insertion efficiency factor